MISSTESLFLLTSGSWSQHLADKGIDVWPRLNFNKRTFDTAALHKIREANIRIVIAVASSEDIAQIALEAETLGLTAG